MSDIPETRYAKSEDCHIAYQIVGKGPIDVVFIPGFVSHVEHGWDDPRLAHFLLLSAFAQSLANDASARESWTALSAAGLQPRRGSGCIAPGLRDRCWSDPVGD